jgi:hypothetical protein
MRFRKGTRYEHPPRGPGRKPYTVSDEALRARRRNLSTARLRSDWESRIIKRLIWQPCFDNGPRPSQRALGRQLGVQCSYVHRVQKQARSVGVDALLREGRVTFADLEKARRFTVRLREQEPGLLAPAPTRRLNEGEPRAEQRRFASAMTANEIIAEQTGFAEEWKRKNPPRYDTRRRIRVPIPH